LIQREIIDSKTLQQTQDSGAEPECRIAQIAGETLANNKH